MKKADVVSAAIAAAFGLTLLFYVVPVWVRAHDEAGGYGLGARVMPNVTATVLTGLAILFLLYRLLARPGAADAETDDDAPPIGESGWRFLLIAALFLIVMAALFEWVGFLAAGPLTIAGFMIAMGERRPVPVVATSVGASAVIWLFFWQLLNFPLP